MELRTLWLAIMILVDLAIVYTMFVEILSMVQMYSCNRRKYHKSGRIVCDLGRKTIYREHPGMSALGRIAQAATVLGILVTICLVLILV